MKRSSTLTFAVLAILIALVALLVLRMQAVRSVVEVGHQATVVARQLTTDVDSVSTSGVDQRFRARREAVASMRADLLLFVRAESMFIADSGVPRSTFPPGTPYAVKPTRGNLLYGFTFSDTALTATATNTMVTTITCSITVPYHLDTTARPPHFVLAHATPVEPVCTQPK